MIHHSGIPIPDGLLLGIDAEHPLWGQLDAYPTEGGGDGVVTSEEVEEFVAHQMELIISNITEILHLISDEEVTLAELNRLRNILGLVKARMDTLSDLIGMLFEYILAFLGLNDYNKNGIPDFIESRLLALDLDIDELLTPIPSDPEATDPPSEPGDPQNP
jgi:hypothetical protein